MKTTTSTIIVALVVFISLSQEIRATVIITKFSFTENSFSFNISGTLPDELPASSRNSIYFVNPDTAADPGFALGNLFRTFNASFTGTQALRSAPGPVGTGNVLLGDYFIVVFTANLSVDENISGLLVATWDSPAFDPTQVTSLNVYWGTDDSLPDNPATQPSRVTGGTYLTSVVVPEPSTAALLIGGVVAAVTVLRRRKR